MPLSDTEIRIYGMHHLVGKTVQACIGALDCGDYEVDTAGSITVEFRSDDQGLFTPQYLEALDGFEGEQQAVIDYVLDEEAITVTVPVVIGEGYSSRGQVLRPALANEMRLPDGAGLGKTRRSHAYAMLLTNTTAGALTVGTDFDSTMSAVDIRDGGGEDALASTEMFSGVHWAPLDDGYSFDSMLCWESTRPLPATVNAVSAFIQAQEG